MNGLHDDAAVLDNKTVGAILNASTGFSRSPLDEGKPSLDILANDLVTGRNMLGQMVAKCRTASWLNALPAAVSSTTSGA